MKQGERLRVAILRVAEDRAPLRTRESWAVCKCKNVFSGARGFANIRSEGKQSAHDDLLCDGCSGQLMIGARSCVALNVLDLPFLGLAVRVELRILRRDLRLLGLSRRERLVVE